jgi:hypothetical protein
MENFNGETYYKTSTWKYNIKLDLKEVLRMELVQNHIHLRILVTNLRGLLTQFC